MRRGVTDNPSIFEKAVMHSDRYDGQYRELIATGKTVEQSYWELQITDINDALEVTAHALDGRCAIWEFVRYKSASALHVGAW